MFGGFRINGLLLYCYNSPLDHSCKKHHIYVAVFLEEFPGCEAVGREVYLLIFILKLEHVGRIRCQKDDAVYLEGHQHGHVIGAPVSSKGSLVVRESAPPLLQGEDLREGAAVGSHGGQRVSAAQNGAQHHHLAQAGLYTQNRQDNIIQLSPHNTFVSISLLTI